MSPVARHQLVMPHVPRPTLVGVGSPAAICLDKWGIELRDLFGTTAYLVGSAGHGKTWRDVDVRVMLEEVEFVDWFGSVRPASVSMNRRWQVLCRALSLDGARITGLPIDFQVQERNDANERYGGGYRHPLGLDIESYQWVPKADQLRAAEAAHSDDPEFILKPVSAEDFAATYEVLHSDEAKS